MKSIQCKMILILICSLYMISGVSAFASVSSTNNPKISLYTSRTNSIHDAISSASYRPNKQYNTRVNLTQRKASSLSISNFKRAKSIFTSSKKEKASSSSQTPMQSSTKITSKSLTIRIFFAIYIMYLMNIPGSLLHLGSNII